MDTMILEGSTLSLPKRPEGTAPSVPECQGIDRAMPSGCPVHGEQMGANKHRTADQKAGHVRLRLTIAYDGTAYSGWQVQKTGTGVQEKVEAALARLFRSKPRLHSSSRTDTGVHAMGLVAHFDIPRAEWRMPIRKLALALNAWLPQDIRVLAAQLGRPGFHARFSATSKQYRYLIWNHSAMNPLLLCRAWHVPRPLDLRAMRIAARQFVGKHDFSAFSANPGYKRISTVRTLTRCDVHKSGKLLTVAIEGDGFLYKMCRGIVGTLVQIGLAQFKPDEVNLIFKSRNRRESGMTAPANGLVLWNVRYGKSPCFREHAP